MEERIDQYITDQMSPKDRQAFETEMDQQPELAEEVAVKRAIMGGVVRMQVDEMKVRLEAVEKQFTAKESPALQPSVFPPKSKAIWYAIGSIAAALLVLFLIVRPTGRNAGTEFDQLYRPYPNYAFPLNRNDSSRHPLYDEAFSAYEAEEYEEALGSLLETPESNPQRTDVRFYIGQCYLAMDSLKQAEAVYKDLLEAESEYRFQLLWYLGLIQLKQGKLEEAHAFIDQLPDNQNWLKRKREWKELLH